MKLSAEIIQNLIRAALEVRKNAFAPYSHFQVGAALLTSDGDIYKGCNVEISSFGITCCAERVALFSAVSDGKRSFEALAVIADDDTVPPCGMCRQALADFNKDLPIILASTDGKYRISSLSELFPEPFDTGYLRK